MEGPKGGKVSSYGSCLSSSAGRKSRPRQIKFYIYMSSSYFSNRTLLCRVVVSRRGIFEAQRKFLCARSSLLLQDVKSFMIVYSVRSSSQTATACCTGRAFFFTFPSSLYSFFFLKKDIFSWREEKEISLLPRIDKSYRHGPRARVFLQSNPGIEGMVYGRKVL